MSHECPKNGCTRTVPSGMLLCPTCWREVPVPLRRALHGAWKGGSGALSPAHQAAMKAIIRYVNREPEAAPGGESS